MQIIRYETIDSTSRQAKKLAENGNYGPLWIIAKTQSRGVGRRANKWISRPGNLFTTALYPHKGDVKTAALYSYIAALAVYDIIAANISKKPAIKWPNDILVGGAKLSGILLESGGDKNNIWLAIGIGINLANAPVIENYKTACLADFGFCGKTPDDILPELIERFEHWRNIFIQNGFAPIRENWQARALGIGVPVKARLAAKTINGIAAGLAADGGFKIKTENGEHVKIHAGDVFFSDKTV